MLRKHTSIAVVLITILTASPAWPSTDAEAMSGAQVISQAEIVVAGQFADRVALETRSLAGQFDASGKPIAVRQVVSLRSFEVHEWIAGSRTPNTITIEIVGGTHEGVTTRPTFVPAVGERIGLAIVPAAHGRFIVVHSKVFAARTASELRSFKTLVSEARATDPDSLDDELDRDLELHPPPQDFAEPVTAEPAVEPPALEGRPGADMPAHGSRTGPALVAPPEPRGAQDAAAAFKSDSTFQQTEARAGSSSGSAWRTLPLDGRARGHEPSMRAADVKAVARPPSPLGSALLLSLATLLCAMLGALVVHIRRRSTVRSQRNSR